MYEKKSLIYFLLTYFFSMIIFLGIFDYLYLKNSSYQIHQKQKAIIKEELLSQDLRWRFWEKNFKDLNVSIYSGNEILKKSPKIGECIDYELKRGFRDFNIIACKIFPDELKKIKEKLFVFNILALIFIMIIAYFLAKLFIKPMKKEIENLESFIRDVTHEIQTPIAIINSNIEILEMQGDKNKNLKRIKNASNRLSKIFNDLKYLRFKEKKLEKLNVKEISKERLNFFATQIENKNLKLNLNIEEVILNIDKEDLTKLIDNLLSNAIKYSPKNSTIEVILNEDFLEIINEGEIKNISKITQKFYRENKSEGGFGLGLYIIKNICDYYGFKLQISSNKKVSIKITFV